MPEARSFPMRGVRHAHFVGIGGAGMCPIAEVLHEDGMTVTGSDLADSPVTRRLAARGVRVRQGHCGKAVAGADVVVVSSAIGDGNPEVAAARQGGVPVVARGEMLGELMRGRVGVAVAGSHGKTTTASLVASIFQAAGLDPTFVIGAKVTGAGANGRLGRGPHLIAEADESDASFLHLRPVIAVITGIDRDHLDTYAQSFERMQAAFVEFARGVPFYGRILIAIDDPDTAALARRIDGPLRTYGYGADADYRALDVRVADGSRYAFVVARPDAGDLSVSIALPGDHNVANALAAIAVASEERIADAAIVAGVAEFQGVERRFRIAPGRIGAKAVTLVDDYGHHPTEIARIIDTVRRLWPDRRLAMIYQPHRFTRTRDLLADFAAVLARVDALLLVEVYSAGEAAIEGADSRALAAAVERRTGAEVPLAATPGEALAMLPGWADDGDVLVLQGAGDIGNLAGAIAATTASEAAP